MMRVMNRPQDIVWSQAPGACAKFAEVCEGYGVKTRHTTWRVWLLALLLAGTAGLVQAQNESNQPPQTEAEADASDTANVSAQPASSPAASARGKQDFSAFKIITERNIFNGNRSGQRITSTRSSSLQRSVQVDQFALVGTLFSSKGPKAFFDGTESDYRKVLQPGGSIAGFQVSQILPSGVRLMEGTNEMDLRVGNGMRREDRGPWKLATGSASYASSSSGSGGSGYDSHSNGSGRSFGRNNSYASSNNNDHNSSSSDSTSTAEVNDVLKRLMEKRQKEIQ